MKGTLPIGNILISLVYAIIAVAILVAAMFAVPLEKETRTKVFLGGQEILVNIADTPRLQEQGLSGHNPLGEKEGMLFVFDAPEQTGFWMKDMFFPLDIMWFDQDQRIIDVWENASPDSYPEIVTPRAPAKFVLEVPAGFFAKYKLKMGNILEITR